MQYKVINYFTDLQDGNHAYDVGKPFPREGLEVSEERIAELSGSNNLQRKPLIAAVEETAVEETAVEETAVEKKTKKAKAQKSADK